MAVKSSGKSRFYGEEDKAFARSVNILSYLQACGEEFEEIANGTYQHTEHNSLRYNARKNILKRFSTDEKGCTNSIDAAIYMYGFTFSQAVHDVLAKAKSIPEQGIQQTVYSKPKNFDYQRDVQEVEHSTRARQYLIGDGPGERGLHPKIVDFCFNAGILAGDKKGNVVFKWADMHQMRNQGLVGASLRGTRVIPEEKRYSPDHKYFRKILAGSQQNAGFFVDMGVPKKLVIGEAPIDVLSYISRKTWEGKESELMNCRFASMEGLKEKTFLNQWSAIYSIQKNLGRDLVPDVLFIVDNDQPGQDFVNKIEHLSASMMVNDKPLEDFITFEDVPAITMADGQLMKDQNNLLLHNREQYLGKSKEPEKVPEVQTERVAGSR